MKLLICKDFHKIHIFLLIDKMNCVNYKAQLCHYNIRHDILNVRYFYVSLIKFSHLLNKQLPCNYFQIQNIIEI